MEVLMKYDYVELPDSNGKVCFVNRANVSAVKIRRYGGGFVVNVFVIGTEEHVYQSHKMMDGNDAYDLAKTITEGED